VDRFSSSKVVHHIRGQRLSGSFFKCFSDSFAIDRLAGKQNESDKPFSTSGMKSQTGTDRQTERNKEGKQHVLTAEKSGRSEIEEKKTRWK